jgi:hypothetical protein
MLKIMPLVLLAGPLLAACSAEKPPTLLPSDRLPVEIDSVDMLQLESYPVQLMLHVTGWLPNPCARPEWIVAGPSDSAGRIEVDLYALPQSNEACIQVLAPFDVNIPLGPAPAGFEIVLNGEVVVRQVEG